MHSRLIEILMVYSDFKPRVLDNSGIMMSYVTSTGATVAIAAAASAALLYYYSDSNRRSSFQELIDKLIWRVDEWWTKSLIANSFKNFKAIGDGELSGVPFTSRWVAAERAIETKRVDALFIDPFASALGEQAGLDFSEKMKGVLSQPPISWAEYHVVWTAVRTRFIDDKITEFASACKSRAFQIVNLGCGLDARPFRLQCLSQSVFFEIDLEEVLECKQQTMKKVGAQALCPLICISVDLCSGEGALQCALKATGFRTNVPTFWFMEGLSMYLPPDVNKSIYKEALSISGKGSQLLCGFIGDASKMPKDVPFTATPDTFVNIVTSTGWKDPQVNIFGDEKLNYGRYPANRNIDYSQCFCLVTH